MYNQSWFECLLAEREHVGLLIVDAVSHDLTHTHAVSKHFRQVEWLETQLTGYFQYRQELGRLLRREDRRFHHPFTPPRDSGPACCFCRGMAAAQGRVAGPGHQQRAA